MGTLSILAWGQQSVTLNFPLFNSFVQKLQVFQDLYHGIVEPYEILWIVHNFSLIAFINQSHHTGNIQVKPVPAKYALKTP